MTDTPKHDELVERLRHIRRDGCYCADKPKKAGQLHPVCLEAADTIEALAALQQPDERDEQIARLRVDAFDEAAKIAVSHSNYGHVEGNRRAFTIASDLENRAKAIRAADFARTALGASQ